MRLIFFKVTSKWLDFLKLASLLKKVIIEILINCYFCLNNGRKRVVSSLRRAYFQAMLIFKYHSFGKRLFSSHAYFQVRAYFRENTVNCKIIGLKCFAHFSNVTLLPKLFLANRPTEIGISILSRLFSHVRVA